MNVHFDRGRLLLQQGRYEQAEQELRQALLADPNDAMAHALLALCLTHSEQYDPATSEAQQAIHLAPEMAFAHYVLAVVMQNRRRLDEAEQAVREAIRIAPHDADYLGLLAHVCWDRRQWAAALDAADQGLACDPEHTACNNLRAMALVKLGRRQEAGATIDATLSRNPEDAFSHANQGWTLLEHGDSQRAMEHFREALRLEPNLDWARQGIIEALKARNPIYGLLLRYFFWMSRLSGRAQWGIVLGGYFGYRYIRSLAKSNPELAPWLWPLELAYILFVLMTWLADPLFNLTLRLNRFGRLALSDDQRRSSNWVGASLFVALISLVAGLISGASEAYILALVMGGLALPLSAIHRCDVGWPRTSMAAYSALLASVGVGGVVALVLGLPIGLTALGAFGIGIFANNFIANGLMMATVRK